MKLAGAGRILFWNGGSVWIGRAGTQPTDFHSHHAVQISLALADADVRLCGADGGWKSYRAAIVAANTEHAFDGGGTTSRMFSSNLSRTLDKCCSNAAPGSEYRRFRMLHLRTRPSLSSTHTGAASLIQT